MKDKYQEGQKTAEQDGGAKRDSTNNYWSLIKTAYLLKTLYSELVSVLQSFFRRR